MTRYKLIEKYAEPEEEFDLPDGAVAFRIMGNPVGSKLRVLALVPVGEKAAPEVAA